MFAWINQIHQTARDVRDIRRHLHRIEGAIMATAQETVDQLTAQVTKAKTEVLGKIADLEAAVAAGETPDFTELKAAVQGVDDIVPDAPAEPEVPAEPETPVDETPAEGDTPA